MCSGTVLGLPDSSLSPCVLMPMAWTPNQSLEAGLSFLLGAFTQYLLPASKDVPSGPE